MTKKRKIAVVTGTRAEYGILKPLLERIKSSKKLELQLIVTGMHLLAKYGLTINEIKRDGFKINKKIKIYIGNQNNPEYYGKALARGINQFIKTFSKVKPNILVIFGDRLEPLAGVMAASFLKIPIAHIHGGDRTESTDVDESIRHSITRFAHIHFTPTSKTRLRLVKMGEESWRIYKVGALGLDSVIYEKLLTKNELFQKFQLSPNRKLIICLFHSIHLQPERAGKDMREILEAIKKLKIQTIIIYPNNDAGSQSIITEIKKYKHLPFIKVFPSIFHKDYINLLRYTDVFLGNSSSAIIESPSFKIPVVSIGDRQKARERANNIINVNPSQKDIAKAIKKSLYDEKFLSGVKKCSNPYGDGKTSERIIKLLEEIKIDKQLLQKKLTY